MKPFIQYRDANEYKYQMAEDYCIQTKVMPKDVICEPERNGFINLGTNGVLLIKAGYSWDGPSGPTVDTKNFMRGSLVHDAFYQLMRAGRLPRSCKDYADKLLHDICIEDGMSSFRAWYVLKGVSWFAGGSCKSGTGEERKIYTAP